MFFCPRFSYLSFAFSQTPSCHFAERRRAPRNMDSDYPEILVFEKLGQRRASVPGQRQAWRRRGAGMRTLLHPLPPRYLLLWLRSHDFFASRLHACIGCFPSHEMRRGSTELFVGHVGQERDYFSEENFGFPSCLADEQCRSPLSTQRTCCHCTALWA